jgi:hypothetical protein
MNFECYNVKKDFDLLYAVEHGDMRLTVTRITESHIMYSRAYYSVCLVEGALCVYSAVESNVGRWCHIYETIRNAMDALE